LNDYAKPALPRPDPALLYACATGDLGRVDYFPLNAVRWLTPPRDIAALVTSNGTDHLHAELYHFGDQSRDMAAELYLLDDGTYTFLIGQGSDRVLFRREFGVTGPRTRVAFSLPPKQLCRLRITRR
jgi:hypothetical protein